MLTKPPFFPLRGLERPLKAAIQRIQRLMGFNGVLTDGAGGSAQTDLSNRVGPGGGCYSDVFLLVA